MHVIFYQTRISTNDLLTIVEKDFKKNHPLVDPAVYKLKSSRQLFRHVLSNKIFRKHDTKGQNKLNYGYLCDGAKPSQHTIQTKGIEPIIDESKWGKVFKDAITKPVEPNPVESKERPKRNVDYEEQDKIERARQKMIQKVLFEDLCSNLDTTHELIMMTDDELLELFGNFAPEYDNFTKIISNFLHSPYPQERVLKVVEQWYFTRPHHNEQTIENYVNKHYERVESNRWFFSIIHNLDDINRNAWIKRFIGSTVDEDAHIEITDEFTLKTLRTTDYTLKNGQGINVNLFMSDLKKCVAVINYAQMLFVVKDYDGVKDVPTLTILDAKGFKTLMSSINVGKYFNKSNKWVDGNAYTIYNEGKNKNWLLKDGLRFYDERNSYFSFFTGYDYKTLETYDSELIQPFLNHIKEVIANNNETVNEYILNWISFILQKPAGKTGTAIVITGDQGTGKNVFTNVICELMHRYSNPNLTNIDQIIGKFNTALENMKLIICNELTSAETNKYLNCDALKSVITDDTVMINPKNITPRLSQNIANLIMVSNNFTPVQIEGGDRRYVVTVSSSKYKGDFDYFDKLCKSFSKSFYSNLLTFFMKRDISNYNPRKIPMTEVKKQIQELSVSAYELFIQEYIKEFVEGIERNEAYDRYVQWVKCNGFAQANIKTFKSNILPFVKETQPRRNGKRPHIFTLKDDCKCKFDLTPIDDEKEVLNAMM